MNGIILIDKPEGWTSNDIVRKMKGILHEKRVGHSGTLDPMATGLLPVFAGRATRAISFTDDYSKTYLAEIRLGIRTDTQDITGSVLSEREVTVTESGFKDCLQSFTGEIYQVPPMYSALKLNGERLYSLARRGIEVERAPRKITVYGIEYAGQSDNGDYRFRVECSKGTYIRTLCDDIGEALGCGACMSSLRREKTGPLSVENAFTPSQIQELAGNNELETALIPVESIFSQYDSITVSAQSQLNRIRCGTEFKYPASDGLYRIYDPEGSFLMLGRAESGVMKTVKNFFEV